MYTVSQKNDTDVAHYNFIIYQLILLIWIRPSVLLVRGGGSLSTGSPAGQVAMVRIGHGSMYSQAYISTGGSSASIAPCDQVD